MLAMCEIIGTTIAPYIKLFHFTAKMAFLREGFGTHFPSKYLQFLNKLGSHDPVSILISSNRVIRIILLFDNSRIMVDKQEGLYYCICMELEKVAKCLTELGNPLRLSAFRLLIQAGPDGLPVKNIQEYLGIPKSTLSHHISHLISAGLITQRREGRVLRCLVEYDVIKNVLEYLMEDCCAGVVNIRSDKV